MSRIVKQDYQDTYVDDVRIPHRTLNNAEMYSIFTTAEAQVDEWYRKQDDTLFRAVEEAEERLAKITEDLKQNPRVAELAAGLEVYYTLPDDTPVKEQLEALKKHKEISVEHQQLHQPKREAEETLKKAKRAFQELRWEQDEAYRILSFLAGQRDGLRLGLKIASLLLGGSSVAGMDHNKASLLVAGAMVDDGQADSLIAAVVNPDQQVA